MSTGPEKYYKAAEDMLRAGVARRAFGATGIDDSPVDNAARVFNLNDGAGKIQLQQFATQALTANIDPTSSVNLGGTVAQIQLEEEKKAQEEKQKAEDRLYQMLLDRAREASAQLGRAIADMENDFEKKFGDAWREHIANEILEPDLIPQQRDGESISEYRKRLEKALEDEMLNEDGTIKDAYKVGRYAKYAEWAHKQFAKRVVDDYIPDVNDPYISNEAKRTRTEQFKNTATFDELNLASNKVSASSEEAYQIKDEIEGRVAKVAIATSANDLANF